MVFYVTQGAFALRNVSYEPADFAPLTVPKVSGGETNEKELIDSVALGKETFHSVGCEACHLVAPSETAVSSGPNPVRTACAPRRARAKSPKARAIASR